QKRAHAVGFPQHVHQSGPRRQADAQESLLIGTGGNWSRQIMECPQLVQRCRTAPRGFDTDMAAVAAYLAFDSLPRFRRKAAQVVLKRSRRLDGMPVIVPRNVSDRSIDRRQT